MLAVLVALVPLAAVARAGGLPDVLILAAAGTDTNAIAYADPRSRLVASGQFGSVDVVNAGATTPTLAQLQAYDAVLTWSNLNYQDHVGLGNVLADYVDAGGGVVTAVFANSTLTASRFLAGRWLTGGYEVIVTQGGTTTGAASLGTLHVPGHPILAGVSVFAGGSSSFRPTSTALTPGALRIADWSDGKTLVAQHGTLSKRVDLGFYPPSSAAVSTSWVGSTDGGLLLANALSFVATPQSAGSPFCFGDGTGTACPCANAGAPGNGCASSVNAAGANLTASGTASIAADTLQLSGSGMPNSSVLYFQGTSQLGGGAGAVFGDGLRCAGGTVIRLQTKSNVAGASQYPVGAEVPISIRGVNVPGNVRTYQAWYRNASAFCTPSTFNLTNGVELTWSP
ncbi:MAG: hypothetical protein JNK02_17285 [Planctomycetes bacterium]|nr:hypothetical protein [Planctomycetota bacterium]